MRSHKILDHTADLKIKVEGSDEKELFMAAFEAMAEIIKKNACGKMKTPIREKRKCKNTKSVTITKKIAVTSAWPTMLLIDFLSEILTLSHISNAVFCRVEFDELTENSVKAKIAGIKVADFDEDVKAVTFHEAQIKKNSRGNLETVIVFDI